MSWGSWDLQAREPELWGAGRWGERAVWLRCFFAQGSGSRSESASFRCLSGQQERRTEEQPVVLGE